MSNAGPAYSELLAREVLDRLHQLDLVAVGEGGRSAAEVERIRDELGQVVEMWRRLLSQHTPADDAGRHCPRCRRWGGWRRRPWPCLVWFQAHARLVSRAPSPGAPEAEAAVTPAPTTPGIMRIIRRRPPQLPPDTGGSPLRGTQTSKDVTTNDEPSSAATHRPWCAPECDFPSAGGDGAHLGRAWTLTPEDSGRVELRLFEWVGEDTHDEIGVLLSVTERGLVTGYGLLDSTSSAGLTVPEAVDLAECLVAFASQGGSGAPEPEHAR